MDIVLENLNNDPLVMASHPYAFMYVKDVNVDSLNKAANIFNLIVQERKSEYRLSCKSAPENFKLDTLTLLGASFYLCSKNFNPKIFVGISKSLMGLLLQAETTEKNLLKGEDLELNGFDYSKWILTLTPQVQLTLNQSGMKLVTPGQNLTFHKQQVLDLLSEFTSNQTMGFSRVV